MAGPKISEHFKAQAQDNIGRINFLGVATHATPDGKHETVAVMEHYHIDKKGNVAAVKDMINTAQINELQTRLEDYDLPWTKHNNASFNEALDVIKDVDLNKTPLQTITNANQFDQMGSILQVGAPKTTTSFTPNTP